MVQDRSAARLWNEAALKQGCLQAVSENALLTERRDRQPSLASRDEHLFGETTLTIYIRKKPTGDIPGKLSARSKFHKSSKRFGVVSPIVSLDLLR